MYSEHLLKMLRDKPDLSLGEMLKELRKWQDQIEDLKLANKQTSGNRFQKNPPTARIMTETRREEKLGCKFWKNYGTCKYGDNVATLMKRLKKARWQQPRHG